VQTSGENEFVMAAPQDLLKRPASGAEQQDTEADIEKKKKNALAQTGDNAVLQGAGGTLYNSAAGTLLNKTGNQF
jgi:hypothetical protein